MTFSRQDFITFGIGLGVALAFAVGEAFLSSADAAEDPVRWLVKLLIGLGVATGRYITTQLTERGFRPGA